MKTGIFPIGLTVTELKRILADWPETDVSGEPTEVWLETSQYTSAPCVEVVILNRRVDDGVVTADILLGDGRS